MRSLGLDVGDRRIGVAFGDSELRLATPVDVIVRSMIEQDTAAVKKFIREYDVAQVIVGLPRNMDGTVGDQAERVVAFVEHIAVMLSVPMSFWDERLTTVEATRRTQETGARGKKSRRGIDAIAAAVILQDYLDSQHDENIQT